MNVLTDEEIDAVTDKQWDGIRGREIAAAHRAYARAIEAEVIRKLAAGVSVEPVDGALLDDMVEGSHPSYGRGLFTTDNCIKPLYTATAIAAARLQGEQDAIKRLAAGVSVEPDYSNPQAGCYFDGYTKQSLDKAIAVARVQAIEECAKVCEELSPDQVLNPRDSSFFDVTTLACSEAITRLLGKEST